MSIKMAMKITNEKGDPLYNSAIPLAAQNAIRRTTRNTTPFEDESDLSIKLMTIQTSQQQYFQHGGPNMSPMRMPLSMLVGSMEADMHWQTMERDQELLFIKMGLLDASDDTETRRSKLAEAVEKLEKDEAMQGNMKFAFVEELMRREKLFGSLESFRGTVEPMKAYSEDDPVCIWCKKEKEKDLLYQPLDPEAESGYLREAMKGLGTNEEAIIFVLTTRSNEQRVEIMMKYKEMFGRKLTDDLKSELTGNFEDLALAMFMRPPEFDAWTVKEAIYDYSGNMIRGESCKIGEGLGTDEESLIEVIFSRTNDQIRDLREAYKTVATPHHKLTDTKLDEDIENDTSGALRRLLISGSQGKRGELSQKSLEDAVEKVFINGKFTGMFRVNYEKLVDMTKCKRDAKALFQGGEQKLGTDDEVFNEVFTMRNYYELRMIWREYVKLSQRDILNTIKDETSGYLKEGLKAIVLTVRCLPMYFAIRLRAALERAGTDNAALIRIIVGRSETDLEEIKQCYYALTNTTLYRAVDEDTSNEFKQVLLKLIKSDTAASSSQKVAGNM